MLAVHLGHVRQRFDVFREARPAIADPRFQEMVPDALVIAIPRATSFTSAPNASQMFAISLMKLIRVARKAFDAYLIISAVRRSVTMIGARRAGAAEPPAPPLWSLPSPARSVRVHEIANGRSSRRNSGQLTTAKSTGLSAACRARCPPQSPVPTGTVDLLMMISG